MSPLPSLARLSLASEAVPTAGSDSKRDDVANDATGPAAALPELPDHLWALILEAVEMDDPCAEIGHLCQPNSEWRDVCLNEALYAEIGRRAGFYGLLPDWNAVVAYYTTAARSPIPDARTYFRRVCAERKTLQPLLDAAPSVARMVAVNAAAHRLATKQAQDPFDTHLLGLCLARIGNVLRVVPPTRADYHELARIAVAQTGSALASVPRTRADYYELAALAVAQDALALGWVPTDRADYYELAAIAVAQYGEALFYVPTGRADYHELAAIAVAQTGSALEYVPTGRADYHELAAIAVAQDGQALEYVPSERADYGEIEAIARRQLLSR